MGTMRLMVVFGGGLIGIMFLVLAGAPLFSGQVEIGPTTVSIDAIETEGFPEAQYLKVTDAQLLFAAPYLKMSGGKNDPKELSRLTVPAVSKTELRKWEAALAKDEKVDASQFRLFVSFEGKQVAKLWPELKKRAEAGESLDKEPLTMELVGDTELAKNMVFKPYDITDRMKNYDQDQTRWLRYKRHFWSLGRVVKNAAIGVILLLIAVAMFRYHRTVPDDVNPDILDWSAIPEFGGGDADVDVDID